MQSQQYQSDKFMMTAHLEYRCPWSQTVVREEAGRRDRSRKFCGGVGARGVGTATTDGGAGGSGRSTGRWCRNSPTFVGSLGTRSDACLRIIRGVHPPRGLSLTPPLTLLPP